MQTQRETMRGAQAPMLRDPRTRGMDSETETQKDVVTSKSEVSGQTEMERDTGSGDAYSDP